MSSFISIGAQIGGPENCPIGDLKVPLYHLLSKHVTSTHCTSIDEFSIVLRVDGTLQKFGKEGLARLRFSKIRRYITVDVQIPEEIWKPLNIEESKQYLVKQVVLALTECVARLKKEKIAVEENTLFSQLSAAINEYL